VRSSGQNAGTRSNDDCCRLRCQTDWGAGYGDSRSARFQSLICNDVFGSRVQGGCCTSKGQYRRWFPCRLDFGLLRSIPPVGSGDNRSSTGTHDDCRCFRIQTDEGAGNSDSRSTRPDRLVPKNVLKSRARVGGQCQGRHQTDSLHMMSEAFRSHQNAGTRAHDYG
jgi:hypothetical protein